MEIAVLKLPSITTYSLHFLVVLGKSQTPFKTDLTLHRLIEEMCRNNFDMDGNQLEQNTASASTNENLARTTL